MTADERREFAQKTRNKASVALCDIFPLIRAEEKAVHEE